MINLIHNLDINIISYIQKYVHNSFMDKTMPFISFMGNGGFIWILISVILVFQKKYRKVGIMLAITLIVVALLGECIIKNIVQRNRPFLEVNSLKLIIKAPNSYSFPSGHTASSFAAALILTLSFKKYGIPFFLLAVLIAFSRVYLFVHYPSDVIGGIILGIFSACIIYKLFSRAWKSKYITN